MTLALFDTDKTLLDFSTFVNRAFGDATKKEVGQRFSFSHLEPREYAGVDMETIFKTWLERRFQYLPSELSKKVREHWRPVERTYHENLERMLNTQGNLERYVCDGAREFLDKLEERGIPCGVYSGAPIRIHKLSLESLDLARYFKVRASHGFANVKTRPGLMEYCHSQVESQTGKKIPRTRVVAFGDSPKDAIAAKQYGIKCAIILQHSGNQPEDFQKVKPDYTFQSFRQADEIIETVFNL